MAQNFITCDRDQALLLPPDLRDWLPDDHLAWFVIEAIDELELEPFYASYRADGHGAAAHEPKMMLTLLAYAYCAGERSSRGIERRCREDVAFRVICVNQVPDHATIARFRVRHREALADLFGQVLGLCAEAGLVRTGVVAVDGSKFAASASDGAIRTYEQIAREILAEAGRIDEAEDEIHGEARGDELPERLTTRDGRRAWLREAKKRLEQERAAKPEPVPRQRSRRLDICHRRLVEDSRTERRANRAYEAYRARGVMKDGRRFGRPPDPYTPPDQPEGKLNTTDPDAKRMKHGRNFIPAYNAQAAVTEDQVIVAAEIVTEGVDFEQLEPLVAAAERELKDARRRGTPWGRARRRRLLVERPHRLAQRARHGPDRRPRHDSEPTPEDAPRRPLRLHAQGARNRARQRALLAPAEDGRARLRPDQGKPSDRALQTQGPGGRPLGMAPDRRHS
jgi:transposase